MIDWFTVAAQIVNFLILVGLLKHFLYGPIVKAMDEREAAIQKRLQEADEKREEADKRSADYEQKAKNMERQKQAMLDEARTAAEEERKQRMHKAREEADALSREWRAAVEREKDAFLDDVRQQLSRETVQVARKVLTDLAGARIEQLMTDVFISNLQDVEDDQREAFKNAIEGNEGNALVHTAFDLAEDDRAKIKEAVHRHIGVDASLEFSRSEDLAAGIEISAGGRKVAWTMAQYLDDAAHEIRKALEEAGGPSSPDGSAEAASEKTSDRQEAREESARKQEGDQDAEDDRS